MSYKSKSNNNISNDIQSVTNQIEEIDNNISNDIQEVTNQIQEIDNNISNDIQEVTNQIQEIEDKGVKKLYQELDSSPIEIGKINTTTGNYDPSSQCKIALKNNGVSIIDDASDAVYMTLSNNNSSSLTTYFNSEASYLNPTTFNDLTTCNNHIIGLKSLRIGDIGPNKIAHMDDQDDSDPSNDVETVIVPHIDDDTSVGTLTLAGYRACGRINIGHNGDASITNGEILSEINTFSNEENTSLGLNPQTDSRICGQIKVVTRGSQYQPVHRVSSSYQFHVETLSNNTNINSSAMTLFRDETIDPTGINPAVLEVDGYVQSRLKSHYIYDTGSPQTYYLTDPSIDIIVLDSVGGAITGPVVVWLPDPSVSTEFKGKTLIIKTFSASIEIRTVNQIQGLERGNLLTYNSEDESRTFWFSDTSPHILQIAKFEHF